MSIKQTKPSPFTKTTKSRTADSAETSSHKRGSTSGPEASSEQVEGVHVSCLLNAQYHASREAFLDLVHRWIMFAIIILGAGAITDFVTKEFGSLNTILGIATAALGALDLTFDLSNRARTHSMMKRRYFELLADFGDGQKTLTAVQGCIHRYGADEEPVYNVLWKLSWNSAQEMVFGDKGDQYLIPRFDRFFRNVFRYDGKNYVIKIRQLGELKDLK
jgi:hypothetical protein